MNTTETSKRPEPGVPSEGGTLHRLAAFAETTGGGNPAGVWLGRRHPTATTMQAIAADVGYSETAFAIPTGPSTYDVRYFSPLAEVPFCGHATIALGAALGSSGDDEATYELTTRTGPVRLTVRSEPDGVTAELTSVPPSHRSPSRHLLETALELLGWRHTDLDTSIPPTVAFAGAHHLVMAVTERSTLADLSYEFDDLRTLMQAHELTTLQLVWRQTQDSFVVRNPFPVGGVVEDPATGAAAAALGGYLRDAHLIDAPTVLTIHQGHDIGRPSRLTVTVPETDGISVSGRVMSIPA
jgi:PhzF family phenazine biosynthesis protein